MVLCGIDENTAHRIHGMMVVLSAAAPLGISAARDPELSGQLNRSSCVRAI